MENITVVHSVHISRLLLPVATLGYILNTPAPFPNSSYSVEFYGPSISCDTPNNPAFTDRISKIIANHSNSAGNVTYVGFVPTASRSESTTPFAVKTWEDYAIEGLYRALNYTLVYTAPTLDTTAFEMDRGLGENSPATFFVVTPGKQGGQAKNTLKCQLYNSSYAINFTFDNGLPDITYKTERLNGVTTLAADDCHFGRQLHHCNPVTAYFSLMNGMGELLVGAQWHSGKGVYPTQRTDIGLTTLVESPDMNYFHYERPKC